jgi:RNA polymerase sigma factor (sigma-70 family)
VSTAQDLPLAYSADAEGAVLPSSLLVPSPLLDTAPLLRLVPSGPEVELDFELAVRTVRPRLHRYATRRLGDEHEAEELVQEALLRAYSHRDKLRTEEDLAAWATVVTGRLVIDRLRVRNRSISVAEVPEGVRVGRDTADVVVGRDEARTALDALDAMPARQAALLWAREVEGDSYEDLCTRFGMSEPAVRSILTRARKSLRKEYASRGGTLPVAGLSVLAPWLAGITWANRARDLAHRMTAPAALATIGITALGGLVLAPFGLAPSQTTITPRIAVVSGNSAPAVAPAAPAATVRKATHSIRVTPAAAPPRKVIDVLEAPWLPCAESSPVQRAHCAPPVKGAFVRLVPDLPSNPLVHREIGLTLTDYDCTGWHSNPVITCTPGGADR